MGAMNVQVKTLGDKELLRKLRKMEDATSATSAKSKMKQFHAEGAKIVERAAATIVPVRSGTLKATLKSSGTIRAGTVSSGKAKVKYAGPIHFGWRAHNIRPNPYMFKAGDARREEVMNVFEDGIKKLVREYRL